MRYCTTQAVLTIASLSNLSKSSSHGGDESRLGVLDAVASWGTGDLRSLLESDDEGSALHRWHAAVAPYHNTTSLGYLSPLAEHELNVLDPFGSDDPAGLIDAFLPNLELRFPTDSGHDIAGDVRPETAPASYIKRPTNVGGTIATTTMDPMPAHGRKRSSSKRDRDEDTGVVAPPTADDNAGDFAAALWFREPRRVGGGDDPPEGAAIRDITLKPGPVSSISWGAVEASPFALAANLSKPRGQGRKITTVVPARGSRRGMTEQKLFSLNLLIGDPEMDSPTLFNLTQARFPRADCGAVRMFRTNLVHRLRVESLVHDELLARAVSNPEFTAHDLEAAVSSRYLEKGARIPTHLLDIISRWRRYCIIPHLNGHTPPPCHPYDYVWGGGRTGGMRLSPEMSSALFRDLHARWSAAAAAQSSQFTDSITRQRR